MTTTITIRIDGDLKQNAEQLLEEFGLNISSAVNCFLRKVVSTESIPFRIGHEKNNRRRTLEAMQEARRIAADPNTPACTDPAKLEEFLLK